MVKSKLNQLTAIYDSYIESIDLEKDIDINNDDIETDVIIISDDDFDNNNDFNQNDIDIIESLLKSENDAYSDYTNAISECQDDRILKVLEDIRTEELKHLQQLEYLKSKITGKKYDAVSLKIKDETDELIASVVPSEEVNNENELDEKDENPLKVTDDENDEEIEESALYSLYF